MNPNSPDGLLTWGLPNSRWILNQLERKIPVKDVITRYRIFIKSKIFYVSFSIENNINIFIILSLSFINLVFMTKCS